MIQEKHMLIFYSSKLVKLVYTTTSSLNSEKDEKDIAFNVLPHMQHSGFGFVFFRRLNNAQDIGNHKLLVVGILLRVGTWGSTAPSPLYTITEFYDLALEIL